MAADLEGRRALEDERDFLLRSLDDLEHERAGGDLSDDDYGELKRQYTSRAAAVLRALDGPPADPAPEGDEHVPGAARASDAPGAAGPGSPLAAPPGPGGRRGRRLLAAAAVVAFAGLAGALVARSSGERVGTEPGSGTITPTGPSADLARAAELSAEGKILDAIKAYDKVLVADPENVQALAYRGWLVRLTGRAANDRELLDKGFEYVERAIAVDPSYPDARFFRAMMLFQDRNDPAAAVPEFRHFLANDPPPDMVPLVEGALKEAMRQSGQAG